MYFYSWVCIPSFLIIKTCPKWILELFLYKCSILDIADFLCLYFLDFSKSVEYRNTLCSCKKGFACFNCCRHESNFGHLRLSLQAVLVICKGNNLLDVDATSDDNRTMPVYLSKPPIFHMQILEIQSYFSKKNAN